MSDDPLMQNETLNQQETDPKLPASQSELEHPEQAKSTGEPSKPAETPIETYIPPKKSLLKSQLSSQHLS